VTNAESELRFQERIRGLLRESDIPTFATRMTNNGSRRLSIPDICVKSSDGKRRIAIECKMGVGQHAMTQALGQCIVYQVYNYRAVICLPDCCGPESAAIMTATTRHGIDVCNESSLLHTVERLLESDEAFTGPTRYEIMLGLPNDRESEAATCRILSA
jgi:hypothetical protein